MMKRILRQLMTSLCLRSDRDHYNFNDVISASLADASMFAIYGGQPSSTPEDTEDTIPDIMAKVG
jgi:hypothetical protein